MNLATFIEAAQAAQALIAQSGAVKDVFEGAVLLLKGKDQDAARKALSDAAARNDAGFQRLDEKLERAKNR